MECEKLGFKKMVIPKGNYLEEFKKDYRIELVPVYNLRQAIREVLGG